MTSRRGFLSLLVAAPFAAPAMVKAASQEMARPKYMTGAQALRNFDIAEYKPLAPAGFDFERDVAWGIKHLSPADMVAIYAADPVPAVDCDDPVPDYFC